MAVEGNGILRQLHQIEKDVGEIKDDLSRSIDKLTVSVDNLASKFDSFINAAQNSIPIKAVGFIMLFLFIGLFGVESVKLFGPSIKLWLGIP